MTDDRQSECIQVVESARSRKTVIGKKDNVCDSTGQAVGCDYMARDVIGWAFRVARHSCWLWGRFGHLGDTQNRRQTTITCRKADTPAVVSNVVRGDDMFARKRHDMHDSLLQMWILRLCELVGMHVLIDLPQVEI